ncbi:MAG: methyltransferase domain-containing protein [Candidatus Hermodarchaeota archaeon]
MKLNIGCGKKYDPEYCNIDLYEDLVADRLMSAFNLEFIDNSCEEIVAIQVIEHLSFFEMIYALSEFFRVLKPDGRLLLETPDLEKSCQHYLKANDEQKKKILGWFFGIPHKGLQHKICFPPFLLKELLSNIGFNEISTEFYYNYESIPTIRLEYKKPSDGYSINVFQIIANVRKLMLTKKNVDFNDSFITKEQDDLIAEFAFELLQLENNNKRNKVFQFLAETSIKSPLLVMSFIESLENQYILSQKEIRTIRNTAELLLELKFPNILLNSLKKGLLQPGSQKIVFTSIESFGRSIITKMNQSEKDRAEITARLKEMSLSIKNDDCVFFSDKNIERISLDYFYKGIKDFYLGNYQVAHNKFLEAIRLYRDDFLYYWNLAKVLAKLELEDQSIKFFKLALRFLRLKKFEFREEIKLDIKKELRWVKTKQGTPPNLEPIISLEKYNSNN